MRTTNINWLMTPDPHPLAVANLMKIAHYLFSVNATIPEASVGITAISKNTGIADTQLRNLIANRARPGIVIVTVGGRKKFYLLPEFKNYPTDYKNFRGREIIAEINFDLSEMTEAVESVETEPILDGNSAEHARTVETLTAELAKAQATIDQLKSAKSEDIRVLFKYDDVKSDRDKAVGLVAIPAATDKQSRQANYNLTCEIVAKQMMEAFKANNLRAAMRCMTEIVVEVAYQMGELK